MGKPSKPPRSTSSAGTVPPKRASALQASPEPGPPAFFRNHRLQSVLIFSFAFLLYANTLGHQWAQDDTSVIVENMLTQRGFSGIPEIFSTDSFYGYFKVEGKAAVVSGGRYRPLTLAMFAVVHQIFGARPFPYHLLTVTLFALVCLLLYRTLLLLLRDHQGRGYAELLAWMTALLFAAHPIHTEAVANVKGSDEIVTLLGSLGTLYLGLRAADTGKLRYGVFAGVSLWLALLAKENAATFLAVVPLALVLIRRERWSRVMQLEWPLLVAFAGFFAMRMAVLPDLFSKPPVELLNNPYLKWTGDHWIAFTPGEKFATILYTLGRYVWLLIAPIRLTSDYYPRHIGIMQGGDPAVIGSVVLYGFLAGYAAWGLWKGKRDLVRFGILYYLITLSIVSNLFFPIGTNMGERFLFMPSLGFCLVVAVLLLRLSRSQPGREWGRIGASLVLFAVITTAFAAKTVLRNPAWHDTKTLAFTDVVTSGNSAKVQGVCGMIYCTLGIEEADPARKAELLGRAVQYNSRAIEIHPTFKSALLNRGVAYYHLGRYEEAIRDQRKVLSIAPDDPKGRANLSLALGGEGKSVAEVKHDLALALQLLRESFQADSTNQETIWQLGVVHAKSGMYAEAVPWFVRFTQLRPDDPAAWGGLEWAYTLSGDPAKAAECRARAEELKQKPANP